MKQVLVRGGGVVVDEVPAPQVNPKALLVRVHYSCISAGTELSGVRLSGMPLYRRALKQPENVRRVLEMVRDQGLARTMNRVRGKLNSGTATGYSAAGEVIAVGPGVHGFSVGDLVACAGAGYANHAEWIEVPANLAVRVPEGLPLEEASTVTLGAIALQGVRRCAPTLGETVAVIGLGVLGQITAQLLSANGCRVIGIDVDGRRVDLAKAHGMEHGVDSSAGDFVERVSLLTDGRGADAVIITAATESSDLISSAMKATRKKGRVVLVGDVGLNLRRGDFYQKELDFFISSSYGPGRYDPVYEEQGHDYPLPYVRWTENRNMQAYLDLLASGRVRLGALHGEPVDIERASEAYAALNTGTERPLIVLLRYPDEAPRQTRVALNGQTRPVEGRIAVGLVGASSFAQGVHLPNILKLRDEFRLKAVMSRTGANAKAVGTLYEAEYCTSSAEEVFADAGIDLVVVCTRHHLHGAYVLEAMRRGKHVLVEKPLALTSRELAEIARFRRDHPEGPLLMVGYNRRFAPAMRKCADLLKDRTTPIIANYTMNAGYLPMEHWVHGEEGGGRNLGEACHIYDLFSFLVDGAAPVSVSAYSVTPSNGRWRRDDNFVATIKYEDGSVCTLTYTAMGSKSHPKERMELFFDGKVITLDDYKSLRLAGAASDAWSAAAPDKGHLEELRHLARALKSGRPPVSFEELVTTSLVSLEVEHQLHAGDLSQRVGDAVCAAS